MPRRHPAILRLLAALALGAATTVAVAWGLACMDVLDPGVVADQSIRPTRGPMQREYLGGPADGVSVRIYARPGRIVILAHCYGPSFLPFPGIPLLDSARESKVWPDQLVPSSLLGLALPWLSGYPWPRGSDADWRDISASGWPLIALASERRLAPNFSHEQRFGIQVGGSRVVGTSFFGSGTSTCRLLPLYPVWAGFMVDVLVFAAAWWLVLITPGRIRGLLRRRRGLCSKCGYDLCATPAGSPCPECGRINTQGERKR